MDSVVISQSSSRNYSIGLKSIGYAHIICIGVLVISIILQDSILYSGGKKEGTFAFVMNTALAYGFLFCISPVVIILASSELRRQSLARRQSCYYCQRSSDRVTSDTSHALPYNPPPIVVTNTSSMLHAKLGPTLLEKRFPDFSNAGFFLISSHLGFFWQIMCIF